MTERTDFLSDRPRPKVCAAHASRCTRGPRYFRRMDPLSDVLRAVRLNGAHFYHVEAGRPWAVLAVDARELTPRVLPESEHLIPYHILLAGRCYGGLAGED